MDTLKELLFERPATIHVVLGAVEIIILVIWARRRTRRWAWAALVAPLLAVAVGLTAHYVQSDGEKIAAIIDEAIAHIEAGEVDAAAECLDSTFSVQGPRGAPVPKAFYVEVSRRILEKWPVKKVARRRPKTTVTGDSAATRVETRIVGKSGEVINGATWELKWIRRREGWRVTSIKAVAPQWMVGLPMSP